MSGKWRRQLREDSIWDIINGAPLWDAALSTISYWSGRGNDGNTFHVAWNCLHLCCVSTFFPRQCLTVHMHMISWIAWNLYLRRLTGFVLIMGHLILHTFFFSFYFFFLSLGPKLLEISIFNLKALTVCSMHVQDAQVATPVLRSHWLIQQERWIRIGWFLVDAIFSVLVTHAAVFA
jgi:hypothetical protein